VQRDVGEYEAVKEKFDKYIDSEIHALMTESIEQTMNTHLSVAMSSGTAPQTREQCVGWCEALKWVLSLPLNCFNDMIRELQIKEEERAQRNDPETKDLPGQSNTQENIPL
jgi:hypothetical protein